jgi:hypothetical protein
MDEEIYLAIIQGHGLVLGRPVWSAADHVSERKLEGLRDPRSVTPVSADNGKTVNNEVRPLFGHPKSIHFPNYCSACNVEDEVVRRVYLESVTGLQLAPRGIKLV